MVLRLSLQTSWNPQRREDKHQRKITPPKDDKQVNRICRSNKIETFQLRKEENLSNLKPTQRKSEQLKLPFGHDKWYNSRGIKLGRKTAHPKIQKQWWPTGFGYNLPPPTNSVRERNKLNRKAMHTYKRPTTWEKNNKVQAPCKTKNKSKVCQRLASMVAESESDLFVRHRLRKCNWIIFYITLLSCAFLVK